MFRYCHNFNQDLSSWDVSNVMEMDYLFHYATSFNSDLSSNVSNVASTRSMFIGATNFTSDLSFVGCICCDPICRICLAEHQISLQTCQVGMYRTLQGWLQCLTKHRTLQEMFLTGCIKCCWHELDVF